MVENKLQLNNDKSHLLVFSSSKRKATTQLASLVEIRTPTNNIRPSSKQRLLGCWLQDNLKWTEHIRDNEESLMKSLNKRLNALKIITKISDFKTRKMIGEGIFLSKLVYMISVWSGCAKDLLTSVQTIQNRAAKLITKNYWEEKSETHLAQLGWLSVNQLSEYHNMLLIHQVKNNRTPHHLYEMYNWEYTYATRQAASNQIKPKGTPRLDISLKTYRWRAAVYYNKVPTYKKKENLRLN